MNSRITWSAIDNPSRRNELQKLAAKLKRKGFGRIQLNSHGAGKFSIDGFADNSDEEDGTLHDYKSGDIIRTATPAEIKASRDAGPEGVIEVDGRACYASR